MATPTNPPAPPKFNRPTLNQAGQILSDQIAETFEGLAEEVRQHLPASRSMSLAMTKLEEANLWIQELISRTPSYQD